MLVRGEGAGVIHSTHQVVEFVGSNWTIQTGDASPAPDPGGTNVSINSLGNTTNSWVYFTWDTDKGNLDDRGHRVWLTSPTNLVVQEDARSHASKTIRWSVISNPGMQVQTGDGDDQFTSDLTASITGFNAVADVTRFISWVTG